MVLESIHLCMTCLQNGNNMIMRLFRSTWVYKHNHTYISHTKNAENLILIARPSAVWIITV